MTTTVLTQDRLKEVLDYESDTGFFTWKISGKGKGWLTGKKAGSLHVDGYINIKIDGKEYRSTRLAFLYVTGQIPCAEIDHINGIRNDDRFINLRPVTHSQNQWNSKKNLNNTSGHKGIFWHSHQKKWTGRVGCNNKKYHVGYFKKIEDAVDAIQSLRSKLHGNFSNNG